MKKQILTILAITFCLAFVGGILAEEINLDNTALTCLGTNCENMNGAIGTLTINNCDYKLHMDIGLSGLTDGNYQLSLQTPSGDKRLDSNLVCDNPNAPMVGFNNAWECGSWQDYSFYNFEMNAVVTDGTFQNSYKVNLPTGDYNVTLLVKHDNGPDGTGGESYPIILQKDNIQFSVSNSCTSDFQDRVIALENRVTDLEAKGCINGTNGLNGESAYQLWIDAGNNGTVNDFLNSLKGTNGNNGVNGANGIPGFNGSDGYTPIAGVNYFNGTQGQQGVAGTNATVNLTSINNNISYFDSVINAIFKYIPGFNLFYHNTPIATENCVTKPDYYFCDYKGYSVREDFYNCQTGQGTATSCNVGKCNYITGHVLCKNCNVNTGKC